jgi:hypothetical protein
LVGVIDSKGTKHCGPAMTAHGSLDPIFTRNLNLNPKKHTGIMCNKRGCLAGSVGLQFLVPERKRGNIIVMDDSSRQVHK